MSPLENTLKISQNPVLDFPAERYALAVRGACRRQACALRLRRELSRTLIANR